MLRSTVRIAARCAFFPVLGFLLGAAQPPASAQTVATMATGALLQNTVPMVRAYAPAASGFGVQSAVRAFPATPAPNSVMFAMAIATTALVSVRLRPRKSR